MSASLEGLGVAAPIGEGPCLGERIAGSGPSGADSHCGAV
jgi:hypothetical protein